MRAALIAHDNVLRTAIESHDGFLFSHTGDGVVPAFASPRSAVDAGVKAQLALELPVRMGMATGEAELRDGASVTACPAPMASSNTCANADDAALPEAVRDASPCRCIHEATSIAAQKRV
jgi:class 3 adenylate cyclase